MTIEKSTKRWIRLIIAFALVRHAPCHANMPNITQLATVERAVFDALGNQWTILTGDALQFFMATLCYLGLHYERHTLQWMVRLLR